MGASGLMLSGGEFGRQSHGVRVRLDADGFFVGETGVFAAVLVDEVERVAGKLHAAGLFAFY